MREFGEWRGRMRQAHEQYHSAWARSFLPAIVARAHRAFPTVRPSGEPRAGTLHTDTGEFKTYFLYGGLPLAAGVDSDLEPLREILVRARDACAARGARLHFVYAPDKYRVYAPLLGKPVGAEVRTWLPNDLPERVREVVASLGGAVSFIDLTGPLLASAKHGDLPYLATDHHWSPTGHAVVAREIHAALLRSPSATTPTHLDSSP